MRISLSDSLTMLDFFKRMLIFSLFFSLILDFFPSLRYNDSKVQKSGNPSKSPVLGSRALLLFRLFFDFLRKSREALRNLQANLQNQLLWLSLLFCEAFSVRKLKIYLNYPWLTTVQVFLFSKYSKKP